MTKDEKLTALAAFARSARAQWGFAGAIGAIALAGAYAVYQNLPARQSAEEYRSDRMMKERALVDWCLGKGGTAKIDSRGWFEGCTIPPPATR